MDLTQFIVGIHITAAACWFGAAAYHVIMLTPTFMQAGPKGLGFSMTMARRGGIGIWFAASGIVTILAGGYVYGKYEIGSHAFDGASNTMLTLGAILAVLTFGHGLAANMPNEKKLIKLVKSINGEPTKEQAQEIGRLGGKLGKLGMHSLIMLSVAMLLMAFHGAF